MFTWTSLRGKYYRHPIAVMRVLDMFGPSELKSTGDKDLVELPDRILSKRTHLESPL